MFTWTVPERWDQFWEDGTSKVEIERVPDSCRVVDGFTNHSTCGKHGGTYNNLPGMEQVTFVQDGESEDSSPRCQCRRHLVVGLPEEIEQFLTEEGLDPNNKFDINKPVWYTALKEGGKVYKVFLKKEEAVKELEKHQFLKEKGITTGEFEGKYFDEGTCLIMDYIGEPISDLTEDQQEQICLQLEKRIKEAGISLDGVDWNPDNILRDSEGRYWFIDFESWSI